VLKLIQDAPNSLLMATYGTAVQYPECVDSPQVLWRKTSVEASWRGHDMLTPLHQMTTKELPRLGHAVRVLCMRDSGGLSKVHVYPENLSSLGAVYQSVLNCSLPVTTSKDRSDVCSVNFEANLKGNVLESLGTILRVFKQRGANLTYFYTTQPISHGSLHANVLFCGEMVADVLPGAVHSEMNGRLWLTKGGKIFLRP
jgi:hypothetical protein